jgi:hypothetical protein
MQCVLWLPAPLLCVCSDWPCALIALCGCFVGAIWNTAACIWGILSAQPWMMHTCGMILVAICCQAQGKPVVLQRYSAWHSRATSTCCTVDTCFGCWLAPAASQGTQATHLGLMCLTRRGVETVEGSTFQ